jgi:hypothetical protein
MKNLLPFSLFESKAITPEDWAGNWQDLPEWKLLKLMGFEILDTNRNGTVTIGSSYSGVRPRLTSAGYVRTADQGYVYDDKGKDPMPRMLGYVIMRFAKNGIPGIPTKELDAIMKANPGLVKYLLDLPKIREEVLSRTGITDTTGDIYKKYGLSPSVVKWLDKSTKKTWKINETTGEIDVEGSFINNTDNKLGFRGVKFGVVDGNFDIRNSGLTSLEGAPREVGGNFYCMGNKGLTSLEWAPQKVGENFGVNSNGLTSLKWSPLVVNGTFSCPRNELKTLEGAPNKVRDEFNCSDNPLVSLLGAPESLGEFWLSTWSTPPDMRLLDFRNGWDKKGDVEFLKTILAKLKEIDDLPNDRTKPVDKSKLKLMLLSLTGADSVADFLLSGKIPVGDKFEIYGMVKDSLPEVWNKVKDQLDPDGATSDLLDLGF